MEAPNQIHHSAIQAPKKRWSDAKASTNKLPSHVPQEFLLEDNGRVVRLLEIRTLIGDMQKLRDDNAIPTFFARRNPADYNPRWDSKGHRTNATEKYFFEKLRDLTAELTRLQANDARKDAGGFKPEIKHKLYLTHQQIVEKTYGAILGVRGRQQQELEKQTGCRIILCGKGISFRKRNSSDDDGDERPHVKIVAPSEEALEKALDQINFLLGNSQRAIAFREENRRRLAITNGTQDGSNVSGNRMQFNPNFIPQIYPDNKPLQPPVDGVENDPKDQSDIKSHPVSKDVDTFLTEIHQ